MVVIGDLKDLVSRWQQTRNPKIFEDIYALLKPIVSKHVSKFIGSGLDKNILELEARKLVAEALERYSKSKGEVGTYVSSYLQGLSRFTNKYQAVLRLPENYSLNYSTFESTRQGLVERLGRDPSAVELADELGWPVEKVRTFLRRNVISEDTDIIPVKTRGIDTLRVMEARAYVASKYGRDAEKLLALTRGLDGPKVSLMEAARRLNMPYPAARKLLQKIESDFEEFVN